MEAPIEEEHLVLASRGPHGIERPQEVPRVRIVQENSGVLGNDDARMRRPQLLRQRQLVPVEALVGFLRAACADEPAPK